MPRAAGSSSTPTRPSSAARPEPVILVRFETTPDDIHGMIAAAGDSHRARRHDLARGRRRARDGEAVRRGLRRSRARRRRAARLAGHELREGDVITIDGGTGNVYLGQMPLVAAAAERGLRDGARLGRRRCAGCSVRANADTPEDAARAREFGAEGIGLCRTEHMFFGEERLPVVQEMILADDEPGRRAALDRLLPFQQSDFEGIFDGDGGLPVTIRLLDPPLHEFLPPEEQATDEQDAGAHPRAARDQSDARHARLPARAHVPGDLRDADPCDRARRRERESAARRRRRDHAPARRLRRGAAPAARADRARLGRGGARVRARDRDDDRAAARLRPRRRDRRRGRVLLLRHERPDADGARPLARRRRRASS